MHARFALGAVLAVTFLSSWSPAQGQATQPLPGCEPSPAFHKILEEKLDGKALEKMKFAEREAFQRQVLEDFIAKYPREYGPYQQLIQDAQWTDLGRMPVLRERFQKHLKENPNDPLAMTLAAVALVHKDTGESIRLLDAAKAKAAQFPWASLELANVYFNGKRADKDKVAENIAAFFAACPGSANRRAQWMLAKNISLQPKVAASLRARLTNEADPKKLKDYETLWGLEFRTRPPQEHEALRAQVAQDVNRLEAVNPKGDGEWLALLVKGCKESGASSEAVVAAEDRLLRAYPRSNEAYEIVSQRWRKAHKEPEDQSDAAGWSKYNKEYEEALKGWIRDFPDNSFLHRYTWFYVVSDDDAVPEKERIAAMDTALKYAEEYEAPDFWTPMNAAQFLVEHGWEPERALGLLNRARAQLAKDRERNRQDDNLSADDLKRSAEHVIWQDQWVNGLMLKAAKQTGKPEEAFKLRDLINGDVPQDLKYQSGYWLNRARLEDLEKHTQDALAYYQLALQARVEPAKAWHGKLRDDLTDEAKALWKQLGGTETAWSVWSKAPGSKAEQLAEGRWEKPTKAIPSFELADLSGKTWRLKELNGKVVLINLWATWCGPCNAELPHLQNLYEKVKDRKDFQVLTFNIDEDLGLVAPFLKEKGYTFPVVPAFSTVVSLLDGFAIPQTWIVDVQGKWRWRQLGYGGGSEADFQQDMMGRLEAVKTNP
jgi:thiol-disulfide isomerase/thioredoxin